MSYKLEDGLLDKPVQFAKCVQQWLDDNPTKMLNFV